MATDLYPPLSSNEIQRWAEFGLITPEQLDELKQQQGSQSKFRRRTVFALELLMHPKKLLVFIANAD